ncbi:MAG TPA: ABC transporter permease [Streptosporangiaceae bacterium]|nr:ABC transporter permease [Streptosporangiaceae bacterium]
MTAPAVPAASAPGVAAALPTVAGRWGMAVRAFRFWLVNYRRTWRGTIYSSVLNPVLYLGAMGLGLGELVDKHGSASLGGVSYLVFLAPGLLAAQAMQTAMGESTYPVMGSVKWLKTYQAAAATPLRPADILAGHLLFTTMRLAMNCTIFLAVMAAFGAVRSPWVLAAVPVAVLTGIAFAAPIEAFAVTREKDQSFAMLFRFGMIPMFLFSGTFFPVTQLPAWIRPLAYVTPLWHGVALCRALSLGTATLPAALGHVAYLAAVAAIGVAAGACTYRRRLYV